MLPVSSQRNSAARDGHDRRKGNRETKADLGCTLGVVARHGAYAGWPPADCRGHVELRLRVSQLRDIYLFEVAPVVFGNLFTVARTLSGFDEKWLFNQAAKRARKRRLSRRMFVCTGIGKWLMTSATERHWDTLIKMLNTET